ncbi:MULTISPECIES: DUF1289 domain-containing protein [Alishewanella]|jgi:predicted Fe-S protein YdhL (DUF1289 family)|uniref:Fe-S protein n=1 Tax=Alishewanella aestuarii B11 TaxID=1197174 RepID=J1Q5I7_9ALTE|nr:MULTISPECIES: DUF1289 domain-containing protein [Alishewanella]EJI86398.1 hypothetical protein AEST_07140 [Alishewanella aestuarii B11]
MVKSPCIRNCCLDQQDCCLGCGRLLSEITEWHQASSRRQQQICDLAAARLVQRDEQLSQHLWASPSE